LLVNTGLRFSIIAAMPPRKISILRGPHDLFHDGGSEFRL
jgi:hypothetical protein